MQQWLYDIIMSNILQGLLITTIICVFEFIFFYFIMVPINKKNVEKDLKNNIKQFQITVEDELSTNKNLLNNIYIYLISDLGLAGNILNHSTVIPIKYNEDKLTEIKSLLMEKIENYEFLADIYQKNKQKSNRFWMLITLIIILIIMINLIISYYYIIKSQTYINFKNLIIEGLLILFLFGVGQIPFIVFFSNKFNIIYENEIVINIQKLILNLLKNTGKATLPL